MDSIFEGSGLGSLQDVYEAVDWSRTALGPVEQWSPTLRSSVGLAMNTRFGVTLLWGPEYTMIYNEAYAEMIGDKHPAALGASARDVFGEIWPIIGPMLDKVRAGDGATWSQDERLLLERRGFPEETFFTFSYSPVPDESGQVEGIIDITVETTREVVDRRRLAVLAELARSLLDLRELHEVIAVALTTLRRAGNDVQSVAVTGVSAIDGEPVDLPGQDVVVEHTEQGPVARLRLAGISIASQDAVLVLGLSPHQPVDDNYLRFLRLVGAAITQALDRVRIYEAERHSADLERQMSEVLQRSLLTEPVRLDSLQIAVRYQAAAEQAQVGGDWYDSFLLPDGDSFAVVVGDVTGHDRQAAAAMAQVRNLLRGIAYTGPDSPASVLRHLDATLRGLDVGTFATAVLARIERDDDGLPVMRWTNAGHPPPVLIAPDGTASLLEHQPEVLLGVLADAGRSDHSVWLAPGSTVVFYTDGLVERRGSDIGTDLLRLRAALAGTQGLDAEQLCDQLLADFGADTEDDIVLLVLRVSPT